MNKFLWFDTETTGTDAIKNGVIQIAGIVVIGGIEKERFNMKCNIHPDDEIEQEALDINGTTREQIAEYPDPKIIYHDLNAIFLKHINKFDKNDKFVPAGQNVGFDKEFLNHFYRKNGKPHPKQNCKGDPFLFSFLHAASFDTLNMAVMYELKKGKKIFFPNYKLETLCKTLGVELSNAHDAMADIDATREVVKIMWHYISRG